MKNTPVANWLNHTFETFDHYGLKKVHGLAKSPMGEFFRKFAILFDWIGRRGALYSASGIALVIFSQTRRLGLSILIALAFGTVFTNMILKPSVARKRPYQMGFDQWWQAVGALQESDGSFPSGHTTATMSVATALFFVGGWSFGWLLFLLAGAMAFSRCYLMVHYPTDVIVALMVGLLSGWLSFFVTNIVTKGRVI